MKTARLTKLSPTSYECIFDRFHFKVNRNLFDNSCHAYCEQTRYGFNRRGIHEIRKHIVDIKVILKQNHSVFHL